MSLMTIEQSTKSDSEFEDCVSEYVVVKDPLECKIQLRNTVGQNL